MLINDLVDKVESNWTKSGSIDSDVAISCRIRLARNILDIPFPHQLSDDRAREVLDLLVKSLEIEEAKELGLEMFLMSQFSEVERQILVEKHLISPVLLEQSERKAVVLNNNESISIMVNEEDHLRLQSFLPGLDLEKAWEELSNIDDVLEKSLQYAFDSKCGYITSCPTNVGTGLRASVMLHLPGLTFLKHISEILSNITKLGFVVRGMYGEGTESSGNLYQISNQVTLGKSEEDIIAGLISVAKQIISSERTARELLYKERRTYIEDKVGRALGILKYAAIISSDEAMKLLSDLRLGVDLKITDCVSANLLTKLIIMTRPAWLLKEAKKDLSPFERDVKRAELIRNKLL